MARTEHRVSCCGRSRALGPSGAAHEVQPPLGAAQPLVVQPVARMRMQCHGLRRRSARALNAPLSSIWVFPREHTRGKSLARLISSIIEEGDALSACYPWGRSREDPLLACSQTHTLT